MIVWEEERYCFPLIFSFASCFTSGKKGDLSLGMGRTIEHDDGQRALDVEVFLWS